MLTSAMLKAISSKPRPTTKYVILESVEYGNKFIRVWSRNDTPETVVLTVDGGVSYKILGYSESVSAAQAFLGVPACCQSMF